MNLTPLTHTTCTVTFIPHILTNCNTYKKKNLKKLVTELLGVLNGGLLLTDQGTIQHLVSLGIELIAFATTATVLHSSCSKNCSLSHEQSTRPSSQN